MSAFLDYMSGLLTAYLILCLFAILIGFPVGLCIMAYTLNKDLKSQTFALNKSEWVCTETQTYHTYLKGTYYRHERCATFKTTLKGENK